MIDGEYQRLGCAVEACAGAHKAHGYCLRHYRQWQRGGIKQDATYCATCGREIAGERGKMYCSGRCKHAAWVKANPERYKALPSNQRKVSAIYAGYCERCGAAFVSRAKRQYCSAACRPRSIRPAAAVNARTCKQCGACFVPHDRVTRPTDYCSSSCKRKVERLAHKVAESSRRARKRGVSAESVGAIKVFERDRWHCRLCGVSTPRSLRGTRHDRAPELDHIVPLARGGEHTYRNTQCACRRCNQLKGARPLGQLLIIG